MMVKPMKIAAGMRSPQQRVYLVLVGVGLLSLLGGASFKLLTQGRGEGSQVQIPEELVAPAEGDGETEVGAVDLPRPFQPAAPELRLASPGLLRSTSPQARVETVASGRLDPFAPVVVPAAPRPQSQPAPVTAVTPPLPPMAVAPLPSVPVPSLPALPPVPVLPTAAGAPTALPAVASSPLDRLAISGVLQIGDRVSAIVQESPGASSRYVVVGDSLAAGALKVVDIDLSSAEPVVVLSYQGETHRRMVGSGAATGML